MPTALTCPRCKNNLQPSATVCPRCGLHFEPQADSAPVPSSAGQLMGRHGTLHNNSHSQYTPTRPLSANGSHVTAAGDEPYSEVSVRTQAEDMSTAVLGRVNGSRGDNRSTVSPAPNGIGANGALSTGALLTSVLGEPGQGVRATTVLARSGGDVQPLKGALDMLPGESVEFQLGDLYLTTKRVLLLAPGTLRSAFLADIDAAGTYTQRASQWILLLALGCVASALLVIYAAFNRLELARYIASLSSLDAWWLAVPLLALGGYLLTFYILHEKRTLFVSVKGRPLITVSISAWNPGRFAPLDEFVNAFFRTKDLTSGR